MKNNISAPSAPVENSDHVHVSVSDQLAELADSIEVPAEAARIQGQIPQQRGDQFNKDENLPVIATAAFLATKANVSKDDTEGESTTKE